MSWCWFAAVHAKPAAALAAAIAGDDDGEATVLAAWAAGRKPVPHAARIDAHVIDPDGDCCWVSLLDIAVGLAPLFDDPAVSGALRAVLSGPPVDAVSTLTRNSTHFAGSVTVLRGPDAARRLRDDPFRRLVPGQILRVPAGLFGSVPPPPGPVIQRYAGHPWPAAGFTDGGPVRD